MKFQIPNLGKLKKLGGIFAPQSCANGSCKNGNEDSCSCCKEKEKTAVTASSVRGGGEVRDMGNAPYAFDIESAAEKNESFREAAWTGKHMQLVLMSIPVGGETGLELHENEDLLMHIVDGRGEVTMGRLKNSLNYKKEVEEGYAVAVPAGTYHNIKNIGNEPLKLYTVYAPPHHPFGHEE